MATRTCVTCGLIGTTDHFSRRQWRKGVGGSRCYNCVEETDDSSSEVAVVRDADSEAYFSDEALVAPFEAGGFRWVALGHYTSGEREGQPCVAKWLIEEDAYSAAQYHGDMRCVHRTLDFVRAFNALKIIDLPIRVHVPTTHRFDADTALPHVVYLREPFIEGYDKWNSNSGWMDDSSEFADAMQALSHFSYHASGGQHVLCDLQGGLYEDEAVLSDPAILSVDMDYGSTDMGVEGILTFFYKHQCSKYCDHRWALPDGAAPYIDSDFNTTVWDTTPDGNQHRNEDHHHNHNHHQEYDHQHEQQHENEEETEWEESRRDDSEEAEAEEEEEYEEVESESESESESDISTSSNASSFIDEYVSESAVSRGHDSYDEEYYYLYESQVSEVSSV